MIISRVFVILCFLMLMVLLAEANFSIVLLLGQNVLRQLLIALIIFSQPLFRESICGCGALFISFILVGLMTSPKVERCISVTQIFKLLCCSLLQSIFACAHLGFMIASTLAALVCDLFESILVPWVFLFRGEMMTRFFIFRLRGRNQYVRVT